MYFEKALSIIYKFVNLPYDKIMLFYQNLLLIEYLYMDENY